METTMSRKRRVIGTVALRTLAILAVLCSAYAARSQITGIPKDGGFVKPCSLDGVNPVLHPDIFGNPALALREYGFIRARDGSWHVIPNCRIY
jgi:hypothetical protein